MTEYGIDYSWARPEPAAIRRGGFTTVMRYLSRDRTGKTLTKAEAGALLRAGLRVVLNFEDNEHRPLQGYATGRDDAVFANNLADTLGAPLSAAIYYSVDTDLSYSQCYSYFLGIKENSRRPVGAYGGARLLNQLYRNGVISYLWQANARSWDHNEIPVVRHIQQLYGHPPKGTPTVPGVDPAAYDVNIIHATHIGGWGDPIQEDTDLSWSKWNDLEKIDMVNQVAEEVARRITGSPNPVTGKPFFPTLGDFTSITIQAVSDLVKTIPGVPAGDATAIAKAVADEITKRLQA